MSQQYNDEFPDDLPVLTERVDTPSSSEPPVEAVSSEQLQHIVSQLEAQLDEKMNSKLAEQQQQLSLAITELKAELPAMVRAAIVAARHSS